MARPDPDQAAPAPSALRRALPSVAVIAAYVVLGLVAFWPALPKISSNIFSNEGDFVEAVWFIGWLPHALLHGLNPFFSHALNVPQGVNLAQNTEAPLLGLLAAPFSLVFSPLVGTNLLLVLGMPVSATAAFVVLRKWNVWWPAAAFGGLVYGFSPYMVGQTQGHPQLMFQPLPPLIALTVVSILQGRGNPRRLGVALGLLITAQYLVSPELLAIVAVFTVGGVACVALRHPHNIGNLARVAARPVGIGLAIAVVLLAYPVWMLIAGPQHVTGPTIPLANPFHNDLLSFVVPGLFQKLSMGMGSRRLRVQGFSDSTETGGYIGFPVLVVVGYLAWRSRRSARTQLAVVLLAVAAVLSLGPTLTIDGRQRNLRLPFEVLGHLPLLRDILPGRISFVAAAFLAAIIAFGLDDLRADRTAGDAPDPARQQRRRRTSAAAAVLVLAALVVTWLPTWPYATIPMAPLPATITRAIPGGDPVTLTYPYDTASVTEPMFWQAMNGYNFRLLGGYVYVRGADGKGTILPARMSPSGLQEFLAAQQGNANYGPPLPLSPQLVATTKATIARYHIRLVIVRVTLPGSGPVVALFTRALGRPKAASGPYLLWTD